MSKDKYAIIFYSQMEAIAFIIFIILSFNNTSFNIFLNTGDLKIGEYHSDIPQF